jgi:hypothetical protein
MTDKIRVRLVPKTPDNRSLTLEYGRISPQLAKQLQPDEGRARKALRTALNEGITAKITRNNFVEGNLPRERFLTITPASGEYLLTDDKG